MSVGSGCPLSLHKPATPLKQKVHRRHLLYTISILFISAHGWLCCTVYTYRDTLPVVSSLFVSCYVLCVRSHPQRRNASWFDLSGVLASLDGERAGTRYLDCDANLKRKSCVQVVAINSCCWYIVFVLKQPS